MAGQGFFQGLDAEGCFHRDRQPPGQNATGRPVEDGGRHRARQIINAAAADLQNFRLPGDRQIVSTVDHRFALSNPALVSAPSKKSFSSVSSPIFACSDFTSTAGVTCVPPPPGPKTSAAPPSSCAFHEVI